MLKFITNNTIGVSEASIARKYQKQVRKIENKFASKSLPGMEMLGWTNLIENYNNHDLLIMKKKADQWKKEDLKYILVIGIGGSYLGVRAAIEMCNGITDFNKTKLVFIYNMAASVIADIVKKISKSKFGIVVISKSGTTIEPSVTFRIFRDLMVKKFGKNYAERMIVAITDKEKGVLHDLAKANHWTSFIVPDDIGGRYSTLSPVGMFPMILAGLNPLQLLKGAKDALKDTKSFSLKNNSAYLYACYRYHFYTSLKKQVENFIVYDPSLLMIGEQYKQMFGESEGKSHKAMYPATSLFTTDLHSMGQYFQEGTRNFIETTLWVNQPRNDIKLSIPDNHDNLKYLNNKSLHFINEKAFLGTIAAHKKGGVNNLIIEISKADEYHYGYLYLWLCKAAMMSAYLLKVNPFNQPGVEAYKSNMFTLLKRK